MTPDGQAAAAIGSDRRITLYPLDGGAANAVPGTGLGDQPIRFDQQAALHVFRFGEVPAVVRRVDVRSGRSQITRTLAPADHTGVVLCAPRLLTPDARSYCYQSQRVLSKLYVASAID